jgi:hypothetical protein
MASAVEWTRWNQIPQRCHCFPGSDLRWSFDYFLAFYTNAGLASVSQEFITDPGGLGAMLAHECDVCGRYRHLFLNQPTLLERTSRFLMFGYDVDSFDDNFVLLDKHAGDVTLLSFVASFGN